MLADAPNLSWNFLPTWAQRDKNAPQNEGFFRHWISHDTYYSLLIFWRNVTIKKKSKWRRDKSHSFIHSILSLFRLQSEVTPFPWIIKYDYSTFSYNLLLLNNLKMEVALCQWDADYGDRRRESRTLNGESETVIA
jgi:hypothetical protein